MLALTAVDHGSESQSGQTKDYTLLLIASPLRTHDWEVIGKTCLLGIRITQNIYDKQYSKYVALIILCHLQYICKCNNKNEIYMWQLLCYENHVLWIKFKTTTFLMTKLLIQLYVRIVILLMCGKLVNVRMLFLRWYRLAHTTSLEAVILYCSVYTSLGQESEQSSLCVSGRDFASVSTIIYCILELFRQCCMFWFPFYYPYQELIRIAPYKHAIWYLFNWGFVDILRNILKVYLVF
jgi:hypothetical protein